MITTNIPEGTEVLIKATIKKSPSAIFPGTFIVEVAGAFVVVRPDQIAGIVQHVEAEAPVDPAKENHNLIELAANQGAEIRFQYAKLADDGTETRLVVPYELFTSYRGNELFGGYDVHADDYRTFRLDRIEGVVEPLH